MKVTKTIFVLFVCVFLEKFSIANVKGLYNGTRDTLQIQDIKPGGFILNQVSDGGEAISEPLNEGHNGCLKISPKECIYIDYDYAYNGSDALPTISLEKGEGGSEKILIDLFCNNDIDVITTSKTFRIQQWGTGPDLPEAIKKLDIERTWNACDELIVISDAKKDTTKEETSENPFVAPLSFLTKLFGF